MIILMIIHDDSRIRQHRLQSAVCTGQVSRIRLSQQISWILHLAIGTMSFANFSPWSIAWQRNLSSSWQSLASLSTMSINSNIQQAFFFNLCSSSKWLPAHRLLAPYSYFLPLLFTHCCLFTMFEEAGQRLLFLWEEPAKWANNSFEPSCSVSLPVIAVKMTFWRETWFV